MSNTYARRRIIIADKPPAYQGAGPKSAAGSKLADYNTNEN